MKSYSETLQYLYDSLPVFHHIGGGAYKPGLENTNRLMNSMDFPFRKYKTIHIAGTNGKGSVSHFIASILQSAGYKVGLYTSPHLVDFGERIRVNGKIIEQQYVIDFVERYSMLFDTVNPSFFEATMAMAFEYFADKNVEIAVIEVGLGGRLDSTNIIEPILSVITNISYDHVAFLGNTLEKIAYEKAGIIKALTPVVIGESQVETQQVFIDKAKEQNASIIFADRIFKVKFDKYINNKMLVEVNNDYKILSGLNGNYQLKNLTTVLAVVEKLNLLNIEVDKQHILDGIENVVENTGLMGRWQCIKRNPLIIADTGHNVSGIMEVIEQLKLQHYNKLHFIIGMVEDKDIKSILNILPKNAIYYFTQAKIKRALSSKMLKHMANVENLNGNDFDDIKTAVDESIKHASSEDLIFIGGSNFVVGEALEYLNHIQNN